MTTELKCGDIVRIVNPGEYCDGYAGTIAMYNDELDTYLVVFVAVRDDGSLFVYNDYEFPREVLVKLE